MDTAPEEYLGHMGTVILVADPLFPFSNQVVAEGKTLKACRPPTEYVWLSLHLAGLSQRCLQPTWAPAQGREYKAGSRQYSSRDIAAYTKLKFRQPGQGTVDEVKRRDLRLELERAEKRARSAKDGGDSAATAPDDGADEDSQQAAKRRKLIDQALALDKDDSDDDETAPAKASNGDADGAGAAGAVGGAVDDDDEDDDDDDDDDDEDDTAALLRELEKIKRERAEEKARQDAEKVEADREDLESQIAVGNPLLNLQAALNRNPSATPVGASSASNGFAVKRRWDDDVIFKNQARGSSEKPQGAFVNDLLRTEFHRRFIKKFVA